LDELLRWYLLPGRTPAAISDREATLLALTLLLFDIPPPHLLQLTPQSKPMENYLPGRVSPQSLDTI